MDEELEVEQRRPTHVGAAVWSGTEYLLPAWMQILDGQIKFPTCVDAGVWSGAKISYVRGYRNDMASHGGVPSSEAKRP